MYQLYYVLAKTDVLLLIRHPLMTRSTCELRSLCRNGKGDLASERRVSLVLPNGLEEV